METKETTQVLNYYHPTWNLAGILDQHNYSHRDYLSKVLLLPHLSMDILHGLRSINSFTKGKVTAANIS